MSSDKRLYMKAVVKIQELIASGEYPPGNRLPPERQLAEEFGMSRPTIREAIIALEAKGMVSVKTGSGVYVLEQVRNNAGLGAIVSPFELVEARVLIEGEAAALAAKMITDEELVELKSALDDMASDDKITSAADRKFHAVISAATQNRVFSSIIEQLWDVQEGLDHIRQAHQAVCMKDDQTRLAEHTAIYDALADRDPQAARIAMRSHFSRVLTALHETNEAREVQEVKQKVSQMRQRFSFERLLDEKSA